MASIDMNFSRAPWLAPSFAVALALSCLAAPICGADEKPVAAKKLPSAEDILERYRKAIGGKEAFRKIRSQHAVGTMAAPAQQMEGKLNVYGARPNKLLTVMTMKGAGDISTGFDGKVAWMKTSLTGPMLLEGKMREQIATEADFDRPLHDPKDFKSMKVVGTEEFNGEECYKMQLVHRTGSDSIEFFSVKTGLQRGSISKQETPFGAVAATTFITDYKQFGDLFLPSRMSLKAAGIETITTFEEMTFDQVEPSKFELPDDVKALLEEPAEQPSDSKAPAAPREGERPREPSSKNNLQSGGKK
jgi:hypothetical protein